MSRIDVSESLRSLKLQPLLAVQLNVSAVQRAGIPDRGLVIGVVSGGWFVGPRLTGKVLEGGSDWQRVLSDGALRLDCRIMLETDDGAHIAMTYRGIRAGSPEVLRRLASGAPVRADEYYLRIQAAFETGTSEYAWLNSLVTIGAGQRLPTGPIYNVFQVG
jgi:hypothetical protein